MVDASQRSLIAPRPAPKVRRTSNRPVTPTNSPPEPSSGGGSNDAPGLALFRVDTGKGVKFVDQGGRVYKDMNDWKANNQLPPGRITYAPNGELKLGSDGNPEMRTENTSATERAKLLVVFVSVLVRVVIVERVANAIAHRGKVVCFVCARLAAR